MLSGLQAAEKPSDIAETLGVQRRYLYTLTTAGLEHTIALAESIFELRAQEDAARNAALKKLQDELRPWLPGPT
jgi:hypothetical protein